MNRVTRFFCRHLLWEQVSNTAIKRPFGQIRCTRCSLIRAMDPPQDLTVRNGGIYQGDTRVGSVPTELL